MTAARSKSLTITRLREKLGSHLQSLRKQRGLTQEELADRAGIDRVAVGYIEQGVRSPKLSTLLSLSQALDVSLHDFFEPFSEVE